MNRGRSRSGGYTIVETLIFLAVSAGLAVSVMLLVNGQQRKTEFTQAVRDFESQMQDIANDISTGYSSYPFSGSNTCKVNASGTVSIDATAPSGSQQRCVYIGRAIQFAPDGNNGAYRTYAVVGRQRDSTGKEVGSITAAGPVALAGAYSQVKSLRSATIGKVSCPDCSGGVVGSFGFFTTFHAYASGSLESGSTNVNIIPVRSTTLGESAASAAAKISTAANLTAASYPTNPPRGITVCLLGSGQYALVNIGGLAAGKLTVESSIKSGSTCP